MIVAAAVFGETREMNINPQRLVADEESMLVYYERKMLMEYTTRMICRRDLLP